MVEKISGDRDSWRANTKTAMRNAARAGFDVEHLLFHDKSLEDAVCDAAKCAIEMNKDKGFAYQTGVVNDPFLKTICGCLANDLAVSWGMSDCVSEDFHSLALSFLYLFPKLWKATNKRLSLDKIEAIDLDELLSERHEPQPW